MVCPVIQDCLVGVVAGSGLNSIGAIKEKGIDIEVKAIETLIPFEKMDKL